MATPIKSQNVRMLHKRQPNLPLTLGQGGMLGGNICSPVDYGSFILYADTVNNGRGFGATGPSMNGTLPSIDANGWPTVPSVMVLSGNFHDGAFTAGVYLMSYDSLPSDNLQIGFNPSVDGGIVNTSTAPASNGDVTQFATLTINPTNTNIIFLYFTAPIRNLKIMMPGYATTSTSRFCSNAVKYHAQFSSLRSMDILRTNRGNASNQPSGNWNNRTKLATFHGETSMSYGGLLGGIPIEDLILFCNQVKALPGSMLQSLWFNIPHTATDDYITQACTLLKSTLDPNLIIYLELGNEIWNTAFTAAHGYFSDAAVTDSTLGYDGCVDVATLSQRAYAKRVRGMALLAEAVFGSGSLTSKIRIILGTQQFFAFDKLAYLLNVYADRSINSYIYAIAGAPYIGLGDSTTIAKTSAQYIAAYFNSVGGAGDVTIPMQIKNVSIGKETATCFGIKAVCYEAGTGGSGQDTHAPSTTLIAYNAELDPGMRSLVSTFISMVYAAGVDGFQWYHLGPNYMSSTDPNSFWSANETITAISPKLQGILDAMNFSMPLPSQIVARNRINLTGKCVVLVANAVLSSGTFSSGGRWFGINGVRNFGNFNIGDQPWFDFGIYVEAAGNYALEFVGGTYNSTMTCKFLIDSVEIGTLNIVTNPTTNPYSSSTQQQINPSFTVALPQGWHCLRITTPVMTVATPFAVQSINFTKL